MRIPGQTLYDANDPLPPEPTDVVPEPLESVIINVDTESCWADFAEAYVRNEETNRELAEEEAERQDLLRRLIPLPLRFDEHRYDLRPQATPADPLGNEVQQAANPLLQYAA